MGSYPKAVNTADLDVPIKNFHFHKDFTGKLIKDYNVEIRAQTIRISKS